LFSAGDAGVGGEAIKMVEAWFGRPRRQRVTPHVAVMFAEAEPVFASTRIARRNRAARAGIAAFKRNVADFETHYIIFIGAEELVLPERRNAGDFERGAEAFARFIEWNSRKPIADGLQRSSRDNSGAGSEPVIRLALACVTNGDWLLEIVAEPF